MGTRQDCVRLLWVGKDRTIDSFEKFFTPISQELAGKIEFVCTDMWRPYLEIIARHCPQALEFVQLPLRLRVSLCDGSNCQRRVSDTVNIRAGRQ
jgi:hypothetical protein